MGNQEYHQMVVKKTFASGAEEWICPTCGRHIIMQWPPNYKRVVLDAGDEEKAHAGGAGGVTMGTAQIELEQTPPDGLDEAIDMDDSYLSPFSDWLNGQDLQ